MATPRVLMIFGFPRSGSTVLGLMLHRRLGAAYCGELKRFWLRYATSAQCTCGEPLDRCPVWSTVAARVLTADGAPYGTIEEVARIQGNERTSDAPASRQSYGLHLSHLYREAATAFDGRVIVDSSKGTRHARMLHGLEDVEAWFLYLVRDPRAAAHSRSRSRSKERPPGRGPRELLAQGNDYYRLARDGAAWKRTDREAAALLSSVAPERQMTLRYEDFATDPEGSLARLAQWLEQPLVPVDQSVPGPHIVAANQPLLKSGGGDAEIRPDRRWESEMAPRKRRLLALVTARRRRLHGYA